jgi:putative SOS response-associated peptidase YedK
VLGRPLTTLQHAFGFAERPNLQPRHNIAPTQTVPIVRQKDGGGRELAWCAGA